MKRTVSLLGLALLLSLGCASNSPPRSFSYVDAVPGDLYWFEKVQDWQERSRRDPNASAATQGASPAPDSDLPDLANAPLQLKMDEFAGAQQLQLAREINRFSQRWAFRHYKKDPDETVEADHWPTFSELLVADGDDCDGLNLLTYELLLKLGFQQDQVYRAVVRRESDGVNHMVVLWFETETDPWVLDITRAASSTMAPISTLRGWTPTAMFNLDHVYNVLEVQPSIQVAHD